MRDRFIPRNRSCTIERCLERLDAHDIFCIHLCYSLELKGWKEIVNPALMSWVDSFPISPSSVKIKTRTALDDVM